MADETTPKRPRGRPRKTQEGPVGVVTPMPPPEPMLVTYSLKNEDGAYQFRCSKRLEEGPFLVFISRDGWQEKRFYIAVSEITTLEVVGHPELVGSPVGSAQVRVNAANGIPPTVAPQAVPEAEQIPQGTYSAQQTWKEQQARAMMLRSDPMKMASTVVNDGGGLEVIGAAWLDGAPPE